MSRHSTKIIGTLVLASPFVFFVILRFISSPEADLFAGTILGRISDPVVLVGTVLSVIAGTLDSRWVWPLGIGAAIGAIGCLFGYSWWAVVGTSVAVQEAGLFIVFAMLFSAYGFIAGRIINVVLISPKFGTRKIS